jgi:hypothetical protein
MLYATQLLWSSTPDQLRLQHGQPGPCRSYAQPLRFAVLIPALHPLRE